MANNIIHTENDNAIVILSDASNLGDSIAITLKKISIRTHVLNLDSIEQIDDSFDRVGAIIIPIDPRSHYQLVRTIILTTLQKNIPLLFLGDGFQILNNVLEGGKPTPTPAHSSTSKIHENKSEYHRIFIPPGSKLAAIIGSGGFVRVNSRHKHGIKESQRSQLLLTSGYSLEDGIIEALESPDHKWVIAVQFNPEIRGEIPPHFDRLFQSIADRSTETKNPINLNDLLT